MAIQACLTKEVTRSKDCNDRFLALLGNDRELDLALLDVKTASAICPCEKNLLYLDIVFPSPTLARNSLGSNEALTLFLTNAPFFFFTGTAPDEDRARR
jgi:hypothetical protein